VLLRLKQQQRDATVRLQSAVRMRAAATERWRRQRSSNELLAATTLQRFVRGKQIRTLFVGILNVVHLWQACTKAKLTTRQFQAIMAYRRQLKGFLRSNEIVVLCAVVKRETGAFGMFGGRKVLAFTSAPRIICVDQELTTVEWEMAWSTRLTVNVISAKEFVVGDLRRSSKFTDILGTADRWKLIEYTKGLEDASKWESDNSSALIASLMSSDAYRPDEMLRYQGVMTKRSLFPKQARWQRRWIVLQGRTVYWFASSNLPKGQLEITEASTVSEYEQLDRVAGSARPHSLVLSTPALQQAGVIGLVLQADSATARDDWLSALREAVPLNVATALSTFTSDPALESAVIQGWLGKRAVHRHGENWRARWCALSNRGFFWFSGYYQIKGSLTLTAGTRVRDLGPRPHSFAISTPEMQRAGLYLGLQAADAERKQQWVDAIMKVCGQAEIEPVSSRGLPLPSR